MMSSSPASEGAMSEAGGMTTGKGCGITGGAFGASNGGDHGPGYPGLRDGWPQSEHSSLESP